MDNGLEPEDMAAAEAMREFLKEKYGIEAVEFCRPSRMDEEAWRKFCPQYFEDNKVDDSDPTKMNSEEPPKQDKPPTVD